MNATTVIYQTENGTYGFRPNRFDWKVGDSIKTEDGKAKAKIIKVISTTTENLKFLNRLINTMDRYSKGVDISKTVNIDGFKFKAIIGQKNWKNEDARSSFFISNIEQIPSFNG